MEIFAIMPVDLMSSEKLSRVPEVVLPLGSFLNPKTVCGGAHGIKLEALAMLSMVKDAKGNKLSDHLFYMSERDH